MWVRFIVLLYLHFVHLEAFPGTGTVAGLIVDTGAIALKLPRYMAILTSKSNFLTYLQHKIFGQHFEERFETIIKIAVEQMPDSATISDVKQDNEEKMTFLNGHITGLKSIEVHPWTDLKVEWDPKGLPSAVVTITFTELKVSGDIKTKFQLKTVDGRAEMRFIGNRFDLKFRLHPRLLEWCYLEMYDVILTYMEEPLWVVRNKDGDSDMLAGMAMQAYFISTEHEVENHIKTTIANVIYYEIPKASPAICDNTKKALRQSKYENFVKKKGKIKSDSDVTDDKTEVQSQRSQGKATDITIE